MDFPAAKVSKVRRVSAYVLFSLAGLHTLVTINNVFFASAPNHAPVGTIRFAGYVVGSIFIPLILAIVALILLGKNKRVKS